MDRKIDGGNPFMRYKALASLARLTARLAACLTGSPKISSALAIGALLLPLGLPAQGPTITQRTTPGKMKIGKVEPGSSFAFFGLKEGDIVTGVGSTKIDDNSSPSLIDEAVETGKTITVIRKGKSITLKPKPSKTKSATSEPARENPLLNKEMVDPE
ncbi:MAG: hypothetical protein C5B49_08195 [Bdellovibrio sp.]|nr:MAG: hypothetical protein C5B49_08195 [Bdellovibrio sp.]